MGPYAVAAVAFADGGAATLLILLLLLLLLCVLLLLGCFQSNAPLDLMLQTVKHLIGDVKLSPVLPAEICKRGEKEDR